MNEKDLWKHVHCCFDSDDGSLPSIAIEPLRVSEIALIFQILTLEGRIVSESPEFHDQSTDQMRRLESVSNAAKLVAEFKASPFHLVFEGIRSGSQELPELGLNQANAGQFSVSGVAIFSAQRRRGPA